MFCPECGVELNTTNYRLVKESCGHGKCRQCLLSAESGCMQCQHEAAVQVVQFHPRPQFVAEDLHPAQRQQDAIFPATAEKNVVVAAHDEKFIITNPATGDCFVMVDCQPGVEEEEQEEREQEEDMVDHLSTHDVIYDNSNSNEDHQQQQEWRQEETPPLEEETERLEEEEQQQQQQVDMEEGNDVGDQDYVPTDCSENNEEMEVVNVPPRVKKQKSSKNSSNASSVPISIMSEENFPAHIRKLDAQELAAVGVKNKYECTQCKRLIARHVVKYHIYCDPSIPKPYSCDQCGASFRTPDHYRYHMETHDPQARLPCSHCPKTFRNKLTLKAHTRANHKGLQAPHVCPHCDKGFFSASKMEQHLTVHTKDTPFRCDTCGKRFRLKENLLKHVQVTHSEAKNFHCTLCDTFFKRKSALTQHMKRQHPDGVGSVNFRCTVCGKGFVHKTMLRRHERVHMDTVQEFHCNLCTAKFSRKDNINRHLRLMHSENELHEWRIVERKLELSQTAGVIGRGVGGGRQGGEEHQQGDEEKGEVIFEDEIIEEVVGDDEEPQEHQLESHAKQQPHLDDDEEGNSGEQATEEELQRKNSVILYAGAPSSSAVAMEQKKREKRQKARRKEQELEEFANMPSDKMEIYRKILMPSRGPYDGEGAEEEGEEEYSVAEGQEDEEVEFEKSVAASSRTPTSGGSRGKRMRMEEVRDYEEFAL